MIYPVFPLFITLIFTYVSDVNGIYSTIDNFIVSNLLNICVNKYYTVNDIDNMSDHLPLCVYINLPVNIMYFSDSLLLRGCNMISLQTSSTLLNVQFNLVRRNGITISPHVRVGRNM